MPLTPVWLQVISRTQIPQFRILGFRKEEITMGNLPSQTTTKSGARITLDEWAVLLALAAALLVRLGVIPKVPW